MALTERQKIFADEYLVDLNATRAYKAAYKNCRKDETAAAAGARLLRNVKERQERTEVTQDRVVRELAAIAFARATDYAEVEVGCVKIKNTDELTDEQVRAIAGIKEGANGIEIKLNDKEKALELLGRHLGMWNDKIDIKVTPSQETVRELERIFGTKS